MARAWVDEEFRDRLLADANAAIGELGLSMSAGLQDQRLKAVANAPGEHNVIVCTLCSCYPLALLGPSPSWYKSEAYRSRVVREPREVLAEFGLRLPEDVRITVWDASAESRYLVLPMRPAGTEQLSEADGRGKIGSMYVNSAKSFLTSAKQLMRRMRDKTPYSQGDRMMLNAGSGWMIEGSPQRLSRDYNQLIDAYNSGARI